MFDLMDALWVPRLIINQLILSIKNIGKKRGDGGRYLPMDEYGEEFDYPRPQLKRDSCFFLNGEWEFAPHADNKVPSAFNKSIKVPYPPQSQRSGYGADPGEEFWYKKCFYLPQGFIKERVLLHFGAVDQIASVYLNGSHIGENEGGYLPFSFDVTDSLNPGENVLMVYVKDTLNPLYPLGKQVRKPGGMWYTNISGIWQSVWMESVPEIYVSSIKTAYDGMLSIEISGNAEEYFVDIYDPEDNEKRIKSLKISGDKTFIEIKDEKFWTPETPYLYPFSVRCGTDMVLSYFAIRTVAIEEYKGKKRICLNHKPVFFHGVLDQGYFSDGIFTPPSYKYYEKDILCMKELGFNTLRKHIKIEPAGFYYACDRLGMFVFQDMVNNGVYSYLKDTLIPSVLGFYLKDTKTKTPESIKEYFISHSKRTLEHLYNFPSVVYYTVFNEGWGQFDSDYVLGVLKETDGSRIYDATSGWFIQDDSDVESVHVYFHKVVHKKRWRRPVIVSEFGGFSYAADEHTAFPGLTYGYGGAKDGRALSERITRLYREEIIPLMEKNVCGTVYTQLSDVEEEVNGLYTYDRKVCKADKELLYRLSEEIYEAYEKTL